MSLPMAGQWNWMIYKVSSNQTILWFVLSDTQIGNQLNISSLRRSEIFVAIAQWQADLPGVAQGVHHLAISKHKFLTVVKNL